MFQLVKVTKKLAPVLEPLKANSPAILSGVAIVGVGVTVFLTAKAAPKAVDILNDFHEREEEGEDISGVEKMTELAPVIAPPAIAAGVTMGAIFASNKISAERISALTAAYSLSKTMLSEFKEKTKETIGEDNFRKVDTMVSESAVRRSTNVSKVTETGHGNDLIYDRLSDRYFRSSANHVQKIVNTANLQLINAMSISLNELYVDLGLRGTKLGEELGWNIDDGQIRVYFNAMVTEDNEPCLVLEFERLPRYRYDRYN